MPKPASVAWISLPLVLDCGMTVGETQNERWGVARVPGQGTIFSMDVKVIQKAQTTKI